MAYYERKSIDELEFRDDFMFGAVMSNKEICKEILEIILDIKIKDIRYITPQKSIDPTYFSKGVRLDIFVVDSTGRIYNVEMQNDTKVILPKRSRYYRSATDTTWIKRGNSYASMGKSVMIFCCTFDPFGKGQYKYTVFSHFREEKDLLFDDGTDTIFLNTKGTKGDITPRLKQLLDYIENPHNLPSDPLFQKIEVEIKRVRRNPEKRREVMILEAKLQDMQRYGEELGIKKGIKKGEAVGIIKGEEKMVLKLLEKMSIQDVAQLTDLTIEQIKRIEKENKQDN